MSAHQLLRALAVWCALACDGAAASAQTAIYPVRNLTFGELNPGLASSVLPSDAARRAELDLQGSGALIVTILPPGQLTSPSGAGLPVIFGLTHGVVRWRKSGNEFVFDPNLPYAFTLPKGQDGAWIYLGGTAVPSPSQAPGQYSATITVTITPAGT
jgi:hypothetical protein